MGHPLEKPRLATYAELEAVPAHLVAEIINGELRVMPRPRSPHARASSRLGMKLGGPFDLGEGGPGGWHIIDEPELHFGPPPPHPDSNVVDPDLAGWRIERMPKLLDVAYFTLAPDWVCEVLSKSTEKQDRTEKMPIYAREGVRHAWLLDPMKRVLEVYALGSGGQWRAPVVHTGSVRVRAEPFDAIELDLSLLWPT